MCVYNMIFMYMYMCMPISNGPLGFFFGHVGVGVFPRGPTYYRFFKLKHAKKVDTNKRIYLHSYVCSSVPLSLSPQTHAPNISVKEPYPHKRLLKFDMGLFTTKVSTQKSAHYCIDLFLQVWFGSNRSLIKRQQSLSAKHRVISKSDLRLSKKTSTRKSTIHFLTSTRKVCLCVRVCIECGVNQSKSICLWICVPACLSVCVCMYMHHVHISYTSSFVLLICFWHLWLYVWSAWIHASTFKFV